MAITDTRVIEFSNKYVRVLCEEMRALNVRIDDAITRWFQINSLVPNDSGEALEDGRMGSEGVQQLTGADLTNAVTQFIAYQTQLNQGGVEAVINKPCVRPLEAR